MNFRFSADLDCEFQTWRHMYRLVPGKYTWTGRYPSNALFYNTWSVNINYWLNTKVKVKLDFIHI